MWLRILRNPKPGWIPLLTKCITGSSLGDQPPWWLKESTCNTEHAEDVRSIPGLGRSPGGGHGNPLQYSCLVWRATVHWVTESQTWLKQLNTHTEVFSVPSWTCISATMSLNCHRRHCARQDEKIYDRFSKSLWPKHLCYWLIYFCNYILTLFSK